MSTDNKIHIRQAELAKRRYSAILILCIYSTQVVTAAVLTHLYLITKHPLFWIGLYYMISFFAAVPQAGFSDESGRKKHLLIASFCVLGAVIWLFTVDMLKTVFPNLPPSIAPLISVLPACLLLGLLGNAIPIARGCLAALKLHDFRVAIGLTTSAIGLGWITVDFLTLALGSTGVLVFSIVLQITVIICIKVLYLFEENYEANKKAIIRKSYRWLLSMLFVWRGRSSCRLFIYRSNFLSNLYFRRATRQPYWEKDCWFADGHRLLGWSSNAVDCESV